METSSTVTTPKSLEEIVYASVEKAIQTLLIDQGYVHQRNRSRSRSHSRGRGPPPHRGRPHGHHHHRFGPPMEGEGRPMHKGWGKRHHHRGAEDGKVVDPVEKEMWPRHRRWGRHAAWTMRCQRGHHGDEEGKVVETVDLVGESDETEEGSLQAGIEGMRVDEGEVASG